MALSTMRFMTLRANSLAVGPFAFLPVSVCVMGRKRSSGGFDHLLMRGDDPKLGHRVKHVTGAPVGKTSKERLLWRCTCGVEGHVTLRKPRTVDKSPHALRCYICHGDPPSKRKYGGSSSGEIVARKLVVMGWPEEAVAVQVMPWEGCKKLVDMYLPLQRLIIHHDGRSHENPMPVDRNKVGKKVAEDKAWDKQAHALGFKVVRLHHKDGVEVWEAYIRWAITHATGAPLYTPAFHSRM
jgi:hypothetical protein